MDNLDMDEFDASDFGADGETGMALLSLKLIYNV